MLEYPVDIMKVTVMLNSQSQPHYDINGLDMFGLCALHKAASWDDIELLDLLLAHSEIDVNLRSSAQHHKNTSLFFAVEHRAVRALRRLLSDVRVDVSVVNSDGLTVLTVIEQQQQQQLQTTICDTLLLFPDDIMQSLLVRTHSIDNS